MRLTIPVIILSALITLACIAAAIAKPLTITRDYGGTVLDYMIAVNEQRDPVRITGKCYSACTLWLGARDVCVAKEARLFFHGPRGQNGKRLPDAQFEFASWEMARRYPAGIRRWFMTRARHKLKGFRELTGAEIIRHGIRECT